jgi:DNA-3-methyladenine glycosylase I
MNRCPWAGSDPLYLRYHDLEWGVPVHEERKLLEMLILEGAQAGLSWLTILRKREEYRRAFANFEPARLARYGEKEIQRLLCNAGIVRHRRKIEAAIANARAFQEIRKRSGSFDSFIWSFVGGRPRQNRFRTMAEVPSRTAESVAMSDALRGSGFGFVGPTICYAFMQAVGMVNDHLIGCDRHREIARIGRNTPSPQPSPPDSGEKAG